MVRALLAGFDWGIMVRAVSVQLLTVWL